jgi:hypothetical protein
MMESVDQSFNPADPSLRTVQEDLTLAGFNIRGRDPSKYGSGVLMHTGHLNTSYDTCALITWSQLEKRCQRQTGYRQQQRRWEMVR